MLIKQKYKSSTSSDDPTIRILELGIADGVTAFPLCTNLTLLGCAYSYEGIDIKLSESLREQYAYTLELWKSLTIIEQTTTKFLQLKKEEPPIVYDLVLVDGDHNYDTVKAECELLSNFIDSSTILLFDDYGGKFATEDQYYAHHEGYESNPLITDPLTKDASSPVGVKAAVNEFIANNIHLQPAHLFPPSLCSALLVINRNSPLWSYNVADDPRAKSDWDWLSDMFYGEHKEVKSTI